MYAPTIVSAGTPFLLLPVGIRSTVQLSTFRHPLHIAIEDDCEGPGQTTTCCCFCSVPDLQCKDWELLHLHSKASAHHSVLLEQWLDIQLVRAVLVLCNLVGGRLRREECQLGAYMVHNLAQRSPATIQSASQLTHQTSELLPAIASMEILQTCSHCLSSGLQRMPIRLGVCAATRPDAGPQAHIMITAAMACVCNRRSTLTAQQVSVTCHSAADGLRNHNRSWLSAFSRLNQQIVACRPSECCLGILSKFVGPTSRKQGLL
jgi:hypothetical protein